MKREQESNQQKSIRVKSLEETYNVTSDKCNKMRDDILKEILK